MESFLSARCSHWAVYGVPAFQDNYLWVVVNENAKSAAVIDPGLATPIIEFLRQHELKLSEILVTHHHPDHIGGLSELTSLDRSKFPPPIVTGTKSGRIETASRLLGDGESFEALGLEIEVIEVPGHTRDHLAYHVKPVETGQPGWLFCGDTLFSSGCGRLFEGSHEQMYESLKKLSALPDETLVFCAHEYTLANLKFSRHVEPDNQTLIQEFERVTALREQGKSSIPSSIGHEKKVNLFLSAPDVESFRQLRLAKDHF